MEELERNSTRAAKKCAELGRILVKEEVRARHKLVSDILKKDESVRTSDEKEILVNSADVVHAITKSAKRRENTRRRSLEIEDDPKVLKEKCNQLADALKEAKHAVIYTGAGISTAASIPDYRGPNGVWTLLQQGIQPRAQDLSDAEPTATHTIITKLFRKRYVKYVVSQNCDGLHLRSGLPRRALSEVHGNMYVELCSNCSPQYEYIRLFDVTENTGMRRHKTERKCHVCQEQLRDTIVHFGEKGGMESPYSWEKAAKAAQKADLILCLGSSLKILKKYACLWNMEKPKSRRPRLYIVNLQWTPKDDQATLKINGKCDEVMRLVMKRLKLKLPKYEREKDPIFKLATPLLPHEFVSTNMKILQVPADLKLEKTTDSELDSVNKKKKLNLGLTKKKVKVKKLKTENQVRDPSVNNCINDCRKCQVDIKSEIKEEISATQVYQNEQSFMQFSKPDSGKFQLLKSILSMPPVNMDVAALNIQLSQIKNDHCYSKGGVSIQGPQGAAVTALTPQLPCHFSYAYATTAHPLFSRIESQEQTRFDHADTFNTACRKRKRKDSVDCDSDIKINGDESFMLHGEKITQGKGDCQLDQVHARNCVTSYVSDVRRSSDSSAELCNSTVSEQSSGDCETDKSVRSEDVVNNNVKGTEGVCGKKENSVTRPGWFGKGLNFRKNKKRRF